MVDLVTSYHVISSHVTSRHVRYTMFVAKGREFKFFGDGFKCPECGAGKNKFTEANTDDTDDDLL